MDKVKIRISYEGVGQLLRGDEMRAFIGGYGMAAANRAGEHYGCRVHNTGQRQAANVFPIDREGHQDNLMNNTLLKCIK